MNSKKGNLLELFFNEPTRQWHFEELCRLADLNRKQVQRWLILFRKENLVRRFKPRKRMPYYVAHYQHSDYQVLKRIFAWQKLHTSGFLAHLQHLPQAETVILFGSMTRWDWHIQSDVDLFIYGNAAGLDVGKFEVSLGKDIEVFACQDHTELARYTPGLLKNILKGDFIKGNLDFVQVLPNGV